MQITSKQLSDNHSAVTLTVEPPDYKDEVVKELKQLQKKAVLPGFRTGNIPASVISKKFGKEMLGEKLVKKANDAFLKYISDNKIDLLGRPLMKNGHIGDELNLERNYDFVYEIGTLPEIEFSLPDKTFPCYSVAADDSLVESNIETLRMKYGHVIEPAASEPGDVLKIKYVETDENGNVLNSGLQGGVTFKISTGADDGFMLQFVKLSAGKSVVIKVNKNNSVQIASALNILPDKLKEKEAILQLTVLKIERVVRAELNEDFFKANSMRIGAGNLDEWKNRIREYISRVLAADSERFFLEQVLKEIREKSAILLPGEYLKSLFINITGVSPESPENKHYYEHYVEDIKTEVVKRTIIKKYGINISEDEFLAFTGSLMKEEYPGLFASAENRDLEKENEYYKTLAKLSLQKEGTKEEREKLINRLYDKKITEQLKNTIQPDMKTINYKEFIEIRREFTTHQHSH